MARKLYAVKTSMVKRITVLHRVFADSGSEAERLVLAGQGERVSPAREKIVEQPNATARLVRPIEEEEGD